MEIGLEAEKASSLCVWLGAWSLAGHCAFWSALAGAQGVVGRDVRPAAQVLFFAPPKKSTQKKGGPAACDPDVARRGSRGAQPRGSAAELAAR